MKNPFRRDSGGGRAQGGRRQRRAVVVRTERITPQVVRVVLGGEDLADLRAEHADSYVKVVLPAPGTALEEPLDVAAVRAARPREEWPVVRTYTVRAVDAERGEVTIDFVHHGDEGVAGPWAAAARPGDVVHLMGPGGAYSPDPAAPWHLMVGDASALPAIAASLERVPAGARAVAVVQVHGPAEQQALPCPGELRVHWLHGAPDPEALVELLRSLELPAGAPHAFVHGEADCVRAVRRWVRTDLGVPREMLSASGYWRRGRTEDGWRGEKPQWNAAVESDDAAVASPA
ncbi:siderophore-interacting protein [Kineococcus sp. SYSU DK005]|uniref:siderophore-interacting protein n=1 Tax=Kineococcus sp. SYSU DK005 TaxID=3383126 RepID=UPI003D7E54C0